MKDYPIIKPLPALTVREARAQFSTLVRDAGALGSSYIITNRGRPTAMMVPFKPQAAKKAKPILRYTHVSQVPKLPTSPVMKRLIGSALGGTRVSRNKAEDKQILLEALMEKYMENEHLS